MSVFFVGIDPSLTGTGFIILNDNAEIVEQQLISTEKLKDTPHEIEDRLIKIVDTISTYLKPYNSVIKVVNIESIAYGAKGQKIAEMAALNYIIRIYLHQNKYVYNTIPPTQLKKFITGTGKCQKNLMLLKCFKKFGLEFSDDNICDAYCLARVAYEEYKNETI